MPDAQRITVAARADGERVDVWLARELGLTRGYARRLLARGGVRVAGRVAAKGARLRTGDELELAAFRHPDEGPRAEAGPAPPILHQSGGLLAVDKPAGVPTHPLDFDESGTLLGALLARFPELDGVGEGGLMSGVVHRLDVDTSGVQLFATDAATWRRARRVFETREARKRYVARVHGRLTGERELQLRLEGRGRRVRVVSRGGREAHTRLRGLARGASTSLVELFPTTGVRHQLRVTLAHLGHPVVGDHLYGSDADVGRHLLHAADLELPPLRFAAHSPLPAEFRVEPAGPARGR